MIWFFCSVSVKGAKTQCARPVFALLISYWFFLFILATPGEDQSQNRRDLPNPKNAFRISFSYTERIFRLNAPICFFHYFCSARAATPKKCISYRPALCEGGQAAISKPLLCIHPTFVPRCARVAKREKHTYTHVRCRFLGFAGNRGGLCFYQNSVITTSL